MNDKDLLDELKERIKEGPVIFTPDNDFLDRLNPEDNVELFKDSIKDAADNYRKFKDTYGNKFGRDNIGVGQGSNWRIQHLIAGLILDYWNITSNDHGPVAYCYYGELGKKPRGLTNDIPPCAIMMKNSNIHNHRLKFRFWAESTNNIRPMVSTP